MALVRNIVEQAFRSQSKGKLGSSEEPNHVSLNSSGKLNLECESTTGSCVLGSAVDSQTRSREFTSEFSTSSRKDSLSPTSSFDGLALTQRCILGEEIGHGAYGKVYEARCKQTGAALVVKTVKAKQGKGFDDVESEASVMASLDHPYIVKLHWFLREQTSYHLAMEHCAGGDLTDLLAMFRGRYKVGCGNRGAAAHGVPTELVAGYMRQMIEGLAYLHENGFVHRDLKPDNYLLLTRDRWSPIKLIDFGFACAIRENEKLTRVVGTPSYASPELLAGSYDQLTDVWSLGVTCYAVCTDALPFQGSCRKEYLRNVKAGNFAISDEEWAQHPRELKELVTRMLTYSSAKRPSAMQLKADSGWLETLCRPGKGKSVDQGACCTIC